MRTISRTHPFEQFECPACGFTTYHRNEAETHWCEEGNYTHSNAHSLFAAIRILQSQRDALERVIERGQVPQDFHVETLKYVIDLLTKIETKD